MELQSLFLIVSCAISAVGIITSIITTLSKAKSQKSIKLAKVLQVLPSFIQEAESIFPTGTGVAKLAYVLNKVNIECLNYGVEFVADEWTVEIEKILACPSKK